MKTNEEIYEFCRSHYYCDGHKWEPFETWDDDDIAEIIDNDVAALKDFLKGAK